MVCGGPGAVTSDSLPTDDVDAGCTPWPRSRGESMNRSNGALNQAAIALLAVAAGEQVLEIGPGNAPSRHCCRHYHPGGIKAG